MRQYFFIGGRLFRFPLHLALERAQHDKLVCLRLFLRPIDLQIAQNQRALAVLLKENKRVADKNSRRVKHISVRIARRNDETRRLSFGGHALIVGQPRQLPTFECGSAAPATTLRLGRDDRI